MALPRKEILRRKELGKQRAAVAYIIAHELKLRGFSRSALARKLGVSLNLVAATINGVRHSLIVLDALWDEGISPDLLYDPRQDTRLSGHTTTQGV